MELKVLGADVIPFPCSCPRDDFVGDTDWRLVLVEFCGFARFNVDWGGDGLEVSINIEGAPLLIFQVFKVNICPGFWKNIDLVALIGD